jgi:site-specific DNA-methyltransferase (adenine-specific)
MLNNETLKALAGRAGFNLTAIESLQAAAIPLDLPLACEREIESRFSVCVVALPFDPADRYRPFNAKAEADDSIFETRARCLREIARSLDANGLMFIYGLPRDLARYATALSNDLAFRHWIAIRASAMGKAGELTPEHTGLLLLSKPGARLNRVRIPHARCRHCNQTLKDWGGKSHLMHPRGAALSDVWMDMVVNPADRMPAEVFERILDLSQSPDRANLLLLAWEAEKRLKDVVYHESPNLTAFDPLAWRGQRLVASREIPSEMMNRLINAPCLDALKSIPSETVDLAFADPPFNLTKNYIGYGDNRAERDYIGWCKRWLVEYERVLKPGGSMFILNLPRWAVQIADFLIRTGKLYLQNWIVWNSLPEPKGALMPAHYALLRFTKGEQAARFNYCSMENGWEPFDEAVFPPDRPDVCQRRSCVRNRRASGKTWRGELTDIWHDIHRQRRPIKNGASRKAHPCETPERLIDRILRLATNPGDVALDAFAGTGTTAFVARRLDRRFIAIEQNNDYLQVADSRMSAARSSWQRANAPAKRRAASKRALQLELQRLAKMLGRLPNKRDVETLSKYPLAVFEEMFISWSAALKAAKIIAEELTGLEHAPEESRQLEIFITVQSNGQAIGQAATLKSKQSSTAQLTKESLGSDEDFHSSPGAAALKHEAAIKHENDDFDHPMV